MTGLRAEPFDAMPNPKWRLHGGAHDGRAIPWTMGNSIMPSIVMFDETDEQRWERTMDAMRPENFFSNELPSSSGPGLIQYLAFWGDEVAGEMHAAAPGFVALDDGDGMIIEFARKQRAAINRRYHEYHQCAQCIEKMLSGWIGRGGCTHA